MSETEAVAADSTASPARVGEWQVGPDALTRMDSSPSRGVRETFFVYTTTWRFCQMVIGALLGVIIFLTADSMLAWTALVSLSIGALFPVLVLLGSMIADPIFRWISGAFRQRTIPAPAFNWSIDLDNIVEVQFFSSWAHTWIEVWFQDHGSLYRRHIAVEGPMSHSSGTLEDWQEALEQYGLLERSHDYLMEFN